MYLLKRKIKKHRFFLILCIICTLDFNKSVMGIQIYKNKFPSYEEKTGTILFGPRIGTAIFSSQFGGFFEYKFAEQFGVEIGCNWGYMSYGLMHSEARMDDFLNSGNHKIPTEIGIVEVDAISIPIVLKFHFWENESRCFSIHSGLQLSYLTSLRLGNMRLESLKEKEKPLYADYLLLGMDVSGKNFISKYSNYSKKDNYIKPETVNESEIVNKPGKLSINRIQLSWVLGYSTDYKNGFSIGGSFSKAITSFLSYDETLLQEVGNWTYLMLVVSYNFGVLLE